MSLDSFLSDVCKDLQQSSDFSVKGISDVVHNHRRGERSRASCLRLFVRTCRQEAHCGENNTVVQKALSEISSTEELRKTLPLKDRIYLMKTLVRMEGGFTLGSAVAFAVKVVAEACASMKRSLVRCFRLQTEKTDDVWGKGFPDEIAQPSPVESSEGSDDQTVRPAVLIDGKETVENLLRESESMISLSQQTLERLHRQAAEVHYILAKRKEELGVSPEEKESIVKLRSSLQEMLSGLEGLCSGREVIKNTEGEVRSTSDLKAAQEVFAEAKRSQEAAQNFEKNFRDLLEQPATALSEWSLNELQKEAIYGKEKLMGKNVTLGEKCSIPLQRVQGDMQELEGLCSGRNDLQEYWRKAKEAAKDCQKFVEEGLRAVNASKIVIQQVCGAGEHSLTDAVDRLVAFGKIVTDVEEAGGFQGKAECSERKACAAGKLVRIELHKVKAIVQGVRAPEEGREVLKALVAVDEKYEELREQVAAYWVSSDGKGSSVQIVPFLGEDVISQEVSEKLSGLGNYLRSKYGKDFTENSVWHGKASLQRILWQDAEFLKVMQDPLVIKALLRNSLEGGALAKDTTIADLFFWSFVNNRLSFLMSATPNWHEAPVEVHNLIREGHLRSAVFEEEVGSRQIDAAYVEEVKKVLVAVQAVLEPLPKKKIDTDLLKRVHAASIERFMGAFKKLLSNKHRMKALVAVQQNSGITIDSLLNECEEVMIVYEKLLQKHQGEHAAVLGYGFISHGLDARHLAAGLYGFQGNTEGRLKNLLDAAIAGTLSPLAEGLLKIRLEHMFIQILDLREKVGISIEEIREALPL